VPVDLEEQRRELAAQLQDPGGALRVDGTLPLGLHGVEDGEGPLEARVEGGVDVLPPSGGVGAHDATRRSGGAWNSVMRQLR
jgi:hypothetical protein